MSHPNIQWTHCPNMFQRPTDNWVWLALSKHQCFQPPLLCHVVLELEYSEDKVNIPVIIHRPSLYHLSWKLIKHWSTKIWTLNQTNRPFNLCTNLISFDISSYYTLFFPLSIKKANTSCLELVQDNFSLSYKHEKHPPTKKKKLVYLTVLARDLYLIFFLLLYFFLQRTIRNLLWKPKADLRSRGLDRNAVPTNSPLAHLVGMLARNRIRGLAWHVPRQRPDQN